MSEKFYTVEEVADYFSVKISTVRGWIKSGRMKAVKIAGYRIPQSAIDEFIESSK